jgi:hypothetical protein
MLENISRFSSGVTQRRFMQGVYIYKRDSLYYIYFPWFVPCLECNFTRVQPDLPPKRKHHPPQAL